MTNDVGDANHDIDATYRISRRNPPGVWSLPLATLRDKLHIPLGDASQA